MNTQDLIALADTMRSNALAIFDGCPQNARDVIEWYDGSIRAALATPAAADGAQGAIADDAQRDEWVSRGGFFHRLNGEDHACIPLAAWRATQAPAAPASERDKPPLGWRCTRHAGHDGPCAAVEDIRTVSEQPPHFARGYATGYADGVKDGKATAPASGGAQGVVTDKREFPPLPYPAQQGPYPGDWFYTPEQMQAYALADRAAQPLPQHAQPVSVEDMCSLIKAADDAAAERDYMLDSDDCISVLRGTWKGPLLNDHPKPALQPVAAPSSGEQSAEADRKEGKV